MSRPEPPEETEESLDEAELEAEPTLPPSPVPEAAKKVTKAKDQRKRRFVPAPPWAPFPRDVHLVWVWTLVLGATLVVMVLTGCTFVNIWRLTGQVHLAWAAVSGVALGATVWLLGKVFEQQLRADPTGRFFEWIDWVDTEEAKSRYRDKPAKARPKRPAAPSTNGPEYWMHKLAMRLDRLKRLEKLEAPPIVIEQERRLIRLAIAELTPAQALSVMRAGTEVLGVFESKQRQTKTDKEN